MSEYVAKQELAEILDDRLQKQIHEITDLVQTFIGRVDERFNDVETRFDGLETKQDTFAFKVDGRFDKLEAHQDATDSKIDRLVTTIDGFIARIDHYETEQAARDAQFERLLVWARKVSEKTGIPLESL